MRAWIVVLLTCAACGAGCAPIGTVRLRAVDALSGQPLTHAQVERQVPMYQPSIPLCYPVACYFSNSMCEKQPVNSEGQAEFSHVLTDQRFMVSAPGYDPVLVDRVVPWTSAKNWTTDEKTSALRRHGVITVSLTRSADDTP